MARYSGGDGRTKVVFALSLASISSPTTTELSGASDWTGYIMKDGLSEPSDQNNTPVASLLDTFDAQVPGSFGGVIELTMQRDDSNDLPWDEIEYGLEGFLIIRSGSPAGSAFEAGDAVRVYPVIWHEPVPVAPSANTPDQFTASGPVSRQPDLKATVAS